MSFIPIPHACTVELRFTMFSQRVELTLSFSRGSDYDEAALQDITQKISEWWFATLRTRQGNQLSLNHTYARALHALDAPVYTNTNRSGQAGTVTGGTPLPGNVTYGVYFYTSKRGRAHRGRNFVPGFRSGMVNSADGNLILTTVRDNFLTDYRALLPGGTSDPTPHVWGVPSRYLDNSPRDPGVITNIVSVSAPTLAMASMKKRLTGRGF